MTPTEQRPSECKHCLGETYCFIHDSELLTMDLCELIGGKKHCPDYQPKEKKENDSRTTEKD